MISLPQCVTIIHKTVNGDSALLSGVCVILLNDGHINSYAQISNFETTIPRNIISRYIHHKVFSTFIISVFKMYAKNSVVALALLGMLLIQGKAGKEGG